MAVLKNIILAASVLAPLVAAVPMLGVDKRAIYTNTVTEIEWVTVEETTTVWVDQAAPTQAPVALVSTTDSVPATATYIPTTLATIAAAAAPQAPATSIPAAAATYTPPAVPAPAPEAPSVAPIPAPAASSPAPVPTSTPLSSNVAKDTVGSDGACQGSGDACQGDVTHWDGGLGACGWSVDSNSQYQIALPFAFMGTQSNGNPYCGRSVTLFNPTSGTTVQATVGDKCMGCVDRAIDCTNVLFDAITDGEGDGRMSGIQWWLN